MYNEPTTLVAVLGDGTRFINGKQRVKQTSYKFRDVSQLKWAPNCKREENKTVDTEGKKRKQDLISKQKSLGFGHDDIAFANSLDLVELDEFDELADGDRIVRELTVEELLQSMSTFDQFQSTSSMKSSSPMKSSNQMKSLSQMKSRNSSRMSLLDKSVISSKVDINSPDMREYIFNKLSEQEKKQLVSWLSSLRNMILTNAQLQNLKYLKEMEVQCETIFENMKNPYTKFSHCIIGPRYSGKSTFLAVLIAKIGERLSMNGQWKKTYMFYISFKDVANNLDNLLGIYQSFVNATFAQAEFQIPKFAPFAKRCASFFCGVPTNKNAPVFPKRVAIDKVFHYADIKMTKLADQVLNLFNDPTKFVETIDFIFNFPKEVAKIFGMTEVHYVLDDFDECDVDLFDLNQRQGKKRSPILLIERLKHLLPHVSYVLSCQNLPHFLDILDSINKESIELKTKVYYVNIADLPIEPPESKFEVLVKYDDGHTSFRVNRDNCQGCVGFIVQWDRLIKLGQVVENNQKLQSKVQLRKSKVTPQTEDDIRVVDYARIFLPRIFTHDELPSSKICSVCIVDPRTL